MKIYRKGELIRPYRILVALAALALPLLWGCEPADPGSPYANQPPDTRVVVAPVEDQMHDHYVSPEQVFNVQWFGSDSDGQVVGYYLQVDTGPWVWTTATDSAISFESSIPDPNNPGKTLPTGHTIRVKALDDEGLEDATPAERSFSATNYIPMIREFVSDFRNNAEVGKGISFSIDWVDSNSSGAYFRLWVDDDPVTDWDSRSTFQFCKTSEPSILNTVDSGAVKPVDIGLLPAGPRTLMVKVKDWGGAVSDSVTRTVIVVDTLNPMIDEVLPTYDGDNYYPDGSIFWVDGATTHFTVTGTADAYFGNIQAFRNRLMPEGGTAEWSAWGAGSYDVSDLAPGAYRFESQCRDWSGRESDVSDYDFQVYNPVFASDGVVKILIVDETRDGNGRPGSPDDAQSDEAWRSIFNYDTTSYTTPDGWVITELDYTNRVAGPVKYISAKDVFDKDLVIWHSDDKSNLDLKAGEYNFRLLGEYLDIGGKMFLCGWDVLSNFTNGDVDTAVFSSSGFARRYLRVTGGSRSPGSTKTFFSTVGVEGYGDLQVDPAKVPGNWNGGLDKCWVIYPAHRTEAIETWSGEPFDGRGAVMKNFSPLNPWRTIVCGFPIFFINEAESRPFVVKAVNELIAP